MRMTSDQWTHGLRYTYNVRHCRCDLCRRANTEYMKAYHKRPKRREYARQYMRKYYARTKLTPLGAGPLEPEA